MLYKVEDNLLPPKSELYQKPTIL